MVEPQQRRPRRAERGSAAVVKWKEYRQKRRGPLTEVLKNPKIFELYNQMKTAGSTGARAFKSYEEWLDATQHTIAWREWRQNHKGSLRDVLVDPEGWDLFYAMNMEKRKRQMEDGKQPQPLYRTYGEWLQFPGKRATAKDQWHEWTVAHPGSVVEQLRDPEGWRLYREFWSFSDPNCPETFEEWYSDRRRVCAAIMTSWVYWRRSHSGPMSTILADPIGFQLFKDMLAATGRTVPRTYEEWLSSKIECQVFREWRRVHRGPLSVVLSDPEGWCLYRAAQRNQGITVPDQYEEWIQRQAKINAATKAWLLWRAKHQGLLREVLKESRGCELYRAFRESKGETLPSNVEEWLEERRQVPRGKRTESSTATRAWREWRRGRTEPLATLLKDPEAWSLYSAAQTASGMPAPASYEEFVDQQQHIKSWQLWLIQHTEHREQVPLTELLQDPEAWRLYVNFRTAKGLDVPATYEEWAGLPQQRAAAAAAAWQQWRAANDGALMKVLSGDGEGWTLFRRLMTASDLRVAETYIEWSENCVAGQEIAFKTWKRNQRPQPLRSLLRKKEGYSLYRIWKELAGEELPLTYTNWKGIGSLRSSKESADTVRRGKPWERWRKKHPGCLVEVLADPKGWKLFLRAKGLQKTLTYDEWKAQPQQKETLASEKWVEWRKRHPGTLVEILRDSEGWMLYCALKETVGNVSWTTYDEWLASKDCRAKALREWRSWRKQHPGPVIQVLADATGWILYRTAFSDEYRTLPETFEQYSQRRDAVSKWRAWRKMNPGPIVSALSDLEGWELYREVCLARSESIPEKYEDWLKSPLVDVEDARRQWMVWRGNHAGILAEVLKDPEGWKLFRKSRPNDRSVPETYEEWCNQPEVQRSIIRATWFRWRSSHIGRLTDILEDHEGWELFKKMKHATNSPVPDTYEEWLTTSA